MSSETMTHEGRLRLAHLSLAGLSVGDSFGERFFTSPGTVDSLIAKRAFPKPEWRWTDDTAMAVSVVETLTDHRGIDSAALAQAFARRYWKEPDRGYGAGAHRILSAICEGLPWEVAAKSAFDGQGSFGNGGAMRSAPIGAYFWDDDDAVVTHASASAAPTHAHLEGRAGAIAVAIAAACAVRISRGRMTPTSKVFFEAVIDSCPTGATRDGIALASTLPLEQEVRAVASRLGNGSRVSAQDTVPLCIWLASRHLDSFEEAMWSTVSALGDRDTTCAIVGGIVALSVGDAGIPSHFIEAREALPAR